MRITTCRLPGCGARIELVRIWSLDKVPRKGQRSKVTWMPVDLTEHARDDAMAHIAVSGSGHRRGRVLRAGEQPLGDEERRMTHFATCAARQRELAQRAALQAAEAAGAGDVVVPFQRPTRKPSRPTRSAR